MIELKSALVRCRHTLLGDFAGAMALATMLLVGLYLPDMI